MKTVLIFSNPFGYGPGGKALSVGNMLNKNLKNTKILVCGSSYFLEIIDKDLPSIEVNDRNEESIIDLLRTIPGKKFVFSSQNRFAVKAAKKLNIPTAFLDGLSWFWKEIPIDHFIADIVFWINYPNIKKRVPTNLVGKIKVVEGIVEDHPATTISKRSGKIFYIGGGKNPLTPLPLNYLKLTKNILDDSDNKTIDLTVFSDKPSKKYLTGNKEIYTMDHSAFIRKLAATKIFITNGGQTSTMEAASLNIGIGFYLPINLSQMVLVQKIRNLDKNYPALMWENYIDIPKNIQNYSEKEALIFFENASKKVLDDSEIYEKIKKDFVRLISSEKIRIPKLLISLGTKGSTQIFSVLKKRWCLD